ncbi:hypothetical protein [Nocardioides sp. CER19]|uniref:hypothetical protein n=1 Tax=Nocardioides sp. CER19 TaxID=3038538 RepID=UPI00244AD8FE|nr:hypothetical protein [Nocardioides sp. CER19]MDH2413795.1 hypothetical protein [Nocardioides sp. CER19]
MNVMTDAAARTAGAGIRGVDRVRRQWLACVLGALAGLLFNSWPLGFAVDRPALDGTYFSVLEMSGRPYAHVFVACDLAAGVLAVLAGLLLLNRPFVASGLVMFGVGNVWGALVPINGSCATSVVSCGAAPAQLLEPHTLASTLSVIGLALAASSLWRRGRWMRAVILSCALASLLLPISVMTAHGVTGSQVLFMTACGAMLAAVPCAALTPTEVDALRRAVAAYRPDR